MRRRTGEEEGTGREKKGRKRQGGLENVSSFYGPVYDSL